MCYTTHNRINIKLPKLELPKFDGNLLKWQEFWDSFASSIHENKSLNPVDKLNYLKCNLEGRAKQAIEGLQVSNDNYEVAISVLHERYGNKEHVIQAHYASLSDLPPSNTNSTKLRLTYDSIETSLRSLEALGENVENSYIVLLILSKLPPELKLKLEEQRTHEGNWTTTLLRKQLHKMVLAREIVENSTGSFQQNVNKSVKHLTTEALFVGQSKESPTRKCIFCNELHWNDECDKFVTSEARKDRWAVASLVSNKLI